MRILQQRSLALRILVLAVLPLVAALGLVADAAATLPGPFIDRQAAIDSMLVSLDPNDPDSLTTAIFFYDIDNPTDSVLAPGTVIADFDSSFVDTLACETYFFFVDRQIDMWWGHRCEYVFVEAATGVTTIIEGNTWPVIDGVELTRWNELGDLSPELILGGGYPPPPPASAPETTTLVFTKPPVDGIGTLGAQNPGTTIGLIIAGKNIHSRADSAAIAGDVQRANQLMPNGINITTVGMGLPKGTGATNQQICTAIDNLPKNCKKLHVTYVGHGEKGYMVTRDLPNDEVNNGKLTYEKLACKLLENGAEEVCITIMACKSGSAIKPMKKKSIRVNGKRKYLKGLLITSSSAKLPTVREPDGSAFHRATVACYTSPEGDINTNGQQTVLEAVIWAMSQDIKVRCKKPKATILGGPHVTFGAPYRRCVESKAAGQKTLKYELEVVYYEIPKTGTTAGELQGRGRIYVINPGNTSFRAKKAVDIICYDKAGKEIERKTVTPWLEGNYRWCIGRVSARCRSIKVVKKQNKPGVLDVAVDETYEDIFEGGPRPARYSRGEFIFEEDMIRGPSGESYLLSVDPIPGWGLTIDPTGFTMPAPIDSELVFVRGVMPDTAAMGGLITATHVNTTLSDTTLTEIHTMVFDTLGVPIVDGMGFPWHSLDTELGVSSTAGPVFFDNSVLNIIGSTSVTVGPGGMLAGFYSAVHVDSGLTCPVTVTGGVVDWELFGVVHATDGVVLDGASGFAFNSASYRSQGDGLTLKGDISGLLIGNFDIDTSTDNGLVLDGIPPGTLLPFFQVVDSGAMDVVAKNGTVADLLDCQFDNAKVSVEVGSELTRLWTTVFAVQTASGDSLPGAGIVAVDAFGDTVYTGVTDSLGLAGGGVFTEWVNTGGTVTTHNPYTVCVTTVLGDTCVSYDALDFGGVLVQIDTGTTGLEDPPVARGRLLAQNAPNPFGGDTVIRFHVPDPGRVELAVFDIAGREVDRLVDRVLEAGDHEVSWEAHSTLPSGVYFYRLRVGDRVESRKMILGR